MNYRLRSGEPIEPIGPKTYVLMTLASAPPPPPFSKERDGRFVVFRLKRVLYGRKMCGVTGPKLDSYRLYDSVLATELQLEVERELQVDENDRPNGGHRSGRQRQWVPTRASDINVDTLLGTLFSRVDLSNFDAQAFQEGLILQMEAAFTLYYQLKTSNDWQQVLFAVSQYVRVVTGKPLGPAIESMCRKVVTLFKGVADFVSELQSGDERTNPFTVFRHWMELCVASAKHPVVMRIKKIFYYLMSFSLLERFGISFNSFWYTKAEAELIKNQHSSQAGFFVDLVEGSNFILERLYDCFKTGSWSPIIHSGRTYGKWVDEVYYLREAALKLHNPEANGISYHEFLGRLDSCVEQGEAIVRYSDGLEKSERTLIKKLVSEMRLLKAQELTKKAARQPRQTPFAILYYGGSSIGKSTLQQLTFHHIANTNDLPDDTEYHYNRVYSDEYWSGYQTYMWSIVLDDIAAQNPSAGYKDPSMEEIIQIINQVPFTPPQADLADKGKTPLRPKLVQGTTNVKNLNASAYYCNQLAILRRLPLVVTVVVKAEFAKRVNGMVPKPQDRVLDSSLTPPPVEGEYPDYWEFKLERIVAQSDPTSGVQYAKYVDATPGGEPITSIYDYMAFVSAEFQKHQANQDLVMASEQAYSKVPVCKSCFRPSRMCQCLQSEEESEMNFFTLFVWFVHYLLIAMAWHCSVWVRAHFWQWFSQVRTFGKRVLAVRQQHVNAAVERYLLARGKRAVHRAFSDSCVEVAFKAKSAVDFATQGVRHMASSTMEQSEQVFDLLSDIRERMSRSAMSPLERRQCEATEVRSIMVRCGESVRCSFVSNRMLCAFLIATPTIVGLVSMYRSWTTPQAQTSAEEGGRPTATDEKSNPWYRDEMQPSTFDVGVKSSSWKALPVEQVANKIFRNCHYAKVFYDRDGPKSRKIRILGLGGALYVTNSHNIPDMDVTLEVVCSKKVQGVTNNYSFFLSKDSLCRMEELDLVFFLIKAVPPRVNLLDLIPRDPYTTVCNGVLCGRTSDGLEQALPLRGLRREMNYVHALDKEFDSWLASVSEDTVKGMCGSVVLGFTPQGPMLLGLHQTGGVGKTMSAVKLTREVCEEALAYFKTPMVQAGVPDLKDKAGNPIVLQPLHHKSVFRYLQSGVANVYGSLPGFRAAHKSRVRKTYIADACVERGYQIKTGAPVMKGWEPWRIAAQDIVQQEFKTDQATLDRCVESFAEEILAELSPAQLEELIVLDNATTLNGYPGTKFIDKMNRKTSMGFPERQKKYNFLTYKGKQDVWEDYVEFDDFVYERVDQITAAYESGTRYMPVFTNHLKDEAIKLSKVESKATRAFSGAPAAWSFFVRKHLLTLVRVMQNNKFLFETAPGTNATSAEWDEIYHYLTSFGTQRIVAGDYSKFDKRMGAQWVLAAFEVLITILRAAGRSERDIMLVRGIAVDTAFPLSDFNGDLVEFWGSNPSGHPLTVIINGLVNALLIRYAWSKSNHELSQFKLFVKLMTYGDDNIMGVSAQAENFDHTVLVSELAKIGVIYTMADKEAESVPFIGIENATFLKRGWRFEQEVGHFVAQIEHDSIAKMLTMGLPSDYLCAEAQAVESMRSAVNEYFFYGREEFEKRRAMFLEIIEELDLYPYYVQDFPKFDDLLSNYREDSLHVYPDGVCPLC